MKAEEQWWKKLLKNLFRTQILHASSSLLVFLGWVRQRLQSMSLIYFKRNIKNLLYSFQSKDTLSTGVCTEILRRINPLSRRPSESQYNVKLAQNRLQGLNMKKIIVLDDTEDIQYQGKQFKEFVRYVERYAPQVQLVITT